MSDERDVVERLRLVGGSFNSGLENIAADTIESLRANHADMVRRKRKAQALYAEARAQLSASQSREREAQGGEAVLRRVLEEIRALSNRAVHIHTGYEGNGNYIYKDAVLVEDVLPIIQRGLSATPPNAVEKVIEAARMVVRCHGDNKSIFDLSQSLAALPGAKT